MHDITTIIVMPPRKSPPRKQSIGISNTSHINIVRLVAANAQFVDFEVREPCSSECVMTVEPPYRKLSDVYIYIVTEREQ